MKKLNPQQKKAVNTTEGPLLVFAGAGSGKTMVIIHRIARLLNKGVPPFNILAVTFTNKAAQEMQNRVKQLVGAKGTSVWISTFHALASKILRMDGKEEFTIYDEHDQITAIKQVIKELDIDKNKINPYRVKELISNAKNNLMDPESYLINATASSSSSKYIIGRIYKRYQHLIRSNGGYDFADLLVETINLFKNRPNVLEKYRKRFRYIMVDEYQDTNYAQYMLIKLLAPPQNNVCVVGDDDQCLVKGTEVECYNSAINIEDINKGDKVKSCSGWGNTHPAKTHRVSKRKYTGKVLRIKTEKGKHLVATPNHMMFAKINPLNEIYYVCLMYQKNKGFRIGITKDLSKQDAGKIWILKTCRKQKQAQQYKQYYSKKYNISANSYNGEIKNAEKLMYELFINPLYPHFFASGNSSNKKLIQFTMFGDRNSNPYHCHKIQNKNLDEKIIKDYSKAMKFIEKLSFNNEAEITKKARLVPGYEYHYLPASHIHPRMAVPIYKEDKIIEDTVKSVDWKDYQGSVYDISVPGLRNYISGGIVVHNSIYSWRGADIRNILDFEKHFKCKNTVTLEENYRSTQNILDAAHSVIKHNTSRKSKKLWTRKHSGDEVKWQEFMTNREEALGVVSEIQRLTREEGYSLSGIAVFYRVNAQSRSFEDVLRSAGINYEIIGGLKFYQRKEIKDILAYMKVVANPSDDISMQRIINYPKRGIGKKTQSDLKKIAAGESKSIYGLITEGSDDIPDKIKKKINPLRELFKKLETVAHQDDAAKLAKTAIELSGYHIMLEQDDDIQSRSRMENIEELVSAFAEKENQEKSIQEILTEISLLTDMDRWEEGEDSITLMTVHLAKGLEFPVVFLTGMEEELFPHYDALKDPSQMEEERRLCYVGMTRAKELLYLTSASQRMLYGQSRWHIPSRFVREGLGNMESEQVFEYD
ncbi:MAG: UvrD-helicase domain-containing protein [Elusimicrobiota bacterium]